MNNLSDNTEKPLVVAYVGQQPEITDLFGMEFNQSKYCHFSSAYGLIGWIELNNQIPDVIICDLLLPIINGDRIKKLLEMEYGFIPNQFIVINNSGVDQDELEFTDNQIVIIETDNTKSRIKTEIEKHIRNNRIKTKNTIGLQRLFNFNKYSIINN